MADALAFAGVLTVTALAGVLAAVTRAICWDDELSDLRQNMGDWVGNGQPSPHLSRNSKTAA